MDVDLNSQTISASVPTLTLFAADKLAGHQAAAIQEMGLRDGAQRAVNGGIPCSHVLFAAVHCP